MMSEPPKGTSGKRFSAWSIPELDENEDQQVATDVTTLETTDLEQNQSTHRLTKKSKSSSKFHVCSSPTSACFIGILLGALVNGIILATILTFWLSKPSPTSSHTVIIKNEIPIGTIFLFSGNLTALNDSVHTWLYCNGSEVSRITYRNLFNVIGELYGAGNGNDTFNLPDFRSRFPMGSNNSDSTSLISGGAASHTLTGPEMPAHNHDQGSLQTLASGDHVHGISDPGHNHGGSTGAQPYSSGSFSMNPTGGSGNDVGSHAHTIPLGYTSISILTAGSHIHTVTGLTGIQGANVPFDIIPPYQTTHYIICAQ